MFIFRKINIGGVQLIEGFPNATRQRSEHSRVTTAARRQTAPPHNTAGMAHANGPTARATVKSTSWWWGQEQQEVLNFVDADTTQKATGATSAQIDFVCVICTSNSSTAAVASLSLPLSVCVSLFKGTSQRYRHLSTCPFIFSQLQRSVCTNGIYSLLRSTPVAQLAPRNLLTRWDVSSIPANGIFLTKNKNKKQKKMPNGWRTINSLVHKIRLHGRRGKGMAESFSRQKSRHAPQKEGGLKILCDLPPV